MKRLTYSQTANLLLLVAIIALLTAFPYSQYFLGGLITAIGSASLIAGLADWFAVTALFRKPLGLPYPAFIPTAIVSRNRERLLQALVSMVEEELLTKENLRRQLGEIDLADLLLDYARQPAVKARLQTTLEHTVDYFIAQVDKEFLDDLVTKIIDQHLDPKQLNLLLSQLISLSQAKGFDDKFLTLLLDEILHSIDYQQLHQWLTQVLQGALVRYEKGLTRRQMAGSLLVNAFANADSPRFRKELRQVVNSQLNLLHRKGKARLTLLGEQLATADQTGSEGIRGAGNGGVGEAPWLSGLFQSLAELLKGQVDLTPGMKASFRELILGKIEELWEENTRTRAARQALNDKLRQYLFHLIDSRHYLLGRLVRETLYKFDDQALSDFVEAKAGKDLQVIRISGTLVGGGAGALLYLLTFWLGGY